MPRTRLRRLYALTSSTSLIFAFTASKDFNPLTHIYGAGKADFFPPYTFIYHLVLAHQPRMARRGLLPIVRMIMAG